jgi:hypothetical protein
VSYIGVERVDKVSLLVTVQIGEANNIAKHYGCYGHYCPPRVCFAALRARMLSFPKLTVAGSDGVARSKPFTVVDRLN